MKWLIFITTLAFISSSCKSQPRTSETSGTSAKKKIGGPCEGCEAIYEYGDKILTPVDTLPLFNENEPKLKISGTVYLKDGKTPASDVIVYIYHTNRNGIYQTKGDEKGWGRRHGFIRGWIKTGKDGKYAFYTFRPAGYPGRTDPEHIHVTVKEPDKNEYYIDAINFDDDPRLTDKERNDVENRGGVAIVKPRLNGQIYEVTHNIILGLNIPDYY